MTRSNRRKLSETEKSNTELWSDRRKRKVKQKKQKKESNMNLCRPTRCILGSVTTLTRKASRVAEDTKSCSNTEDGITCRACGNFACRRCLKLIFDRMDQENVGNSLPPVMQNMKDSLQNNVREVSTCHCVDIARRQLCRK